MAKQGFISKSNQITTVQSDAAVLSVKLNELNEMTQTEMIRLYLK